MSDTCPGCRELTKQRDDYKYDSEALRAKLRIIEKNLKERLDRTPRARAFLATLLEIVRD